eukprot:2168189-Pyramimonas_sp.AAC.1
MHPCCHSAPQLGHHRVDRAARGLDSEFEIAEEFLIAIHKKVAVVLSPAPRAAHMASDSKVFRFSNLVMGVRLKLPNMDKETLHCS